MSIVEIYVRAEVLPVRARLVPASGTSHLETLVLRAIAGGVADIAEIADMFGISPRMSLDVVGDLWRVGRIAVDAGQVRETLSITTSGAAELALLTPGAALLTGDSIADVAPILLDKLTGRVLPSRGSLFAPRDRGLLVTESPVEPTRADLRQQAIDEAVAATLRDRRRGTGDMLDGYRVVGTTLAPQTQEPSYRYLPYQVRVNRTADGEITVRAIDERLSLGERELADQRLAAVVHSQPAPAFVNRLRGRAAKSLFKPRGTAELRAEFERAVDSLEQCASANRQSRHDTLAQWARNLFGRFQDATAHQMDVDLALSEGAHVEAVRELIRSASRQLVIAVPWVVAKGLLPLLADLEAAVDRGVRIVLLWGIRAEREELPADVRNHLVALQRRAQGGPGSVHIPGAPAHLHAKVLVADDRAALVTSRNFLSGSHLDEMGVVLRALPDLAAPVIEDLLRWAHSMAPSQAVADQIALTGAMMGLPREPIPMPVLQLPRFNPRLAAAPADGPEVALWLAGWRAVRDTLAANLDRPGRPVVSLVLDGHHRALALDALERAERRVLITSHGLSADALTTGMVEQARRAAARGVLVTLVHCVNRTVDAGRRLTDLQAPPDDGASPTPVVRGLTDWHGKVLVFDDASVVGSFNYLSREAATGRGRSTGELSVRIDDPAIADKLTARLRRTDQAEPPRSWPVAAPVTELAATIAAQDFVEFLRAPLDPGQGRALLTQEPDQVLAVLTNSAPQVVERALAALVATEPPGPAWAKWTDELARRAWSRGAWWAAATLGRCLPGDSGRPSGDFLETVPAILGRHAGSMAALEAPDNLTGDELDALALLAATQLLTTDWQDLFAPLSRWHPRCSADIADIVDLILAMVASHGFVGDQLGRDARSEASSAQADQLWLALDHAVAELRRYKSNTPPGDALLAHLFGEASDESRQGEMAALASAVASRDLEGLATWRAGAEPNGSRWVMRASRSAGLVASAVSGSQRNSFVKKYDAIRVAANKVAQSPDIKLDIDRVDAEVRAFESRLVEQVEAVALRAGMSGHLIADTVRVVRAVLDGAVVDQPPGAQRVDWRFPSLVTAEWAGDALDAETVARHVAVDLLVMWDPPGAVRYIVGAGEFQLAESLLELDETGSALTPSEAGVLQEEIREARRDLRGAVGQALAILRARADAAGVPLPGQPPLAVPLDVARRADVEADLSAWTNEVDRLIADAIATALEQLSELCRGRDQQDAAVIEALVRSGDLVAARELAADASARVPSVIEPRSRAWPDRRIGLTQIVTQLTSEHGKATFRDFRPGPGDDRGAAFVAALAVLAADEGTEPAIRAYVDAFEGLVSTMVNPSRTLSAQGGHGQASYRTELALAHPESLPPFNWSATNTIPIAIGDDDVEGAVFRLSLRVAGRKDEPEVVDVAKALSLLAPVRGGQGLTETRATRLLRWICPQLELATILGPESLGDLNHWRDRARLWTLLDVLGFRISDAGKASLLAVAGQHRRLLWGLLDAAVRDRQKSPDVLMASDWDTGRLLAREDFDDIVMTAVSEDLGSDSVELAVLLAVALWSDDEGLPLADVLVALADLPAVGPNATIESLDRLVARHYLETPQTGRWRLPNTAVGRALTRHHPDEALAETIAAIRRTGAGTEARSDDDAHRMAQVWRQHQPGSAVTTADITRPDRPCDVQRWVTLLTNQLLSTAPDEGPDLIIAPDVTTGLLAAGPSAPIIAAIENLLYNAVEATRGVPGDAEISVVGRADGDAILLTVSDNGPGLPPAVEHALAAGDLVEEGGRGRGLSRLREFAQRYSWSVTAGRSDVLGGAEISLRIPRA